MPINEQLPFPITDVFVTISVLQFIVAIFW